MTRMSTEDAWKRYHAEDAWYRNESFNDFVRRRNIKILRSEQLKDWLAGFGGALSTLLFFCIVPPLVAIAVCGAIGYVIDHAAPGNLLALGFVAVLFLLHGLGVGKSDVK